MRERQTETVRQRETATERNKEETNSDRERDREETKRERENYRQKCHAIINCTLLDLYYDDWHALYTWSFFFFFFFPLSLFESVPIATPHSSTVHRISTSIVSALGRFIVSWKQLTGSLRFVRNYDGSISILVLFCLFLFSTKEIMHTSLLHI